MSQQCAFCGGPINPAAWHGYQTMPTCSAVCQQKFVLRADPNVLPKLPQYETSATEQPPPKPNATTPIWELVQADMAARDHVGRQRYRTPLQAGNGRDALRDLYEELLEAVVYCRQVMAERDAAAKSQVGQAGSMVDGVDK